MGNFLNSRPASFSGRNLLHGVGYSFMVTFDMRPMEHRNIAIRKNLRVVSKLRSNMSVVVFKML